MAANYNEKSKFLVIGATGYLGKYMVKASVSLGYPTYAYVRPINPNTSPSKLQLHKEFESLGITIFQGELNDHDKLVHVFKQVDVVISVLALPQVMDQLNIIKAIKEAGNIKRFIPSEFGTEIDSTKGLPPFDALLERKRKIRRATEDAGIPFTFVAANSFAAYFVDYLIRPHEKRQEVVVYGSGEAKAVLSYEEDVAAYTIKAGMDPRVENRLIICRAPGHVTTQLDLISSWEKKTGRTLKRVHVSEEEILKLSETLPYPDNVPVSILHNIFIKGDQMSFELTDNDLEASKLYPDYNYTSVDDLLNICLVSPPETKLTALY
ncbi:putative Isoflavone reductase [Quillaja saponaria]|uniref:Isoflavone reductase n=1 Tax=Quillaja saponaria TaxID=32244 RepID=A0AAD7P7P1_QUISA|nr:putative Isoflavone reductase [Quillaja saponaria]